jgi:ParB family chromosome partitioning protein
MANDEQQPRRRLGRGLSALLGGGSDNATPQPVADDRELRDVPLDQIDRNPFQPRQDFDDAALAELAVSIKQRGVLQPILVRTAGDRFQLIAGERRLLASKKAGVKTIPCRLLELEDHDVAEAALEENLKREDLNALEKAKAFHDYLGRFECSIEDLARRLGMKRASISNYIRLLDLPESVQSQLRDNSISFGHARALLSLPDELGQVALCEHIQAESLSVRATEKVIRELLKEAAEIIPFTGEKPASKSAGGSPASTPAASNHVRSLQEQLIRHLGSKVEIKLTDKESGRIVVHFSSSDEFERLIRRLRQAA